MHRLSLRINVNERRQTQANLMCFKRHDVNEPPFEQHNNPIFTFMCHLMGRMQCALAPMTNRKETKYLSTKINKRKNS